MNPMLAHPADLSKIGDYLTDAWMLQPKIDGHRLVVECDGKGGVSGYARNGNRTIVPRAATNLLTKLTAPITLDCELLGDTLVAFDLIHAPGGINPDLPADQRWHALNALVGALRGMCTGTPPIQVVPTAFTTDDKRAMIDYVAEHQGEGYIAKKVASPYTPYTGGPRARDWIKLKRIKTVDCIVQWIGTEKQNMGLTLYDEHGHLIIAKNPDEGGVGECTRLAGDGQKVQPGDVVEVQILYVSDDLRLVQPTKPILRHDKDPHECTVDQLEPLRTSKDYVLAWTA